MWIKGYFIIQRFSVNSKHRKVHCPKYALGSLDVISPYLHVTVQKELPLSIYYLHYAYSGGDMVFGMYQNTIFFLQIGLSDCETMTKMHLKNNSVNNFIKSIRNFLENCNETF